MMFLLKRMQILVLAIVLIAACGAKKGTTITGNLKGAENMTVFLDKVDLGNSSQVVLSDKVGSDGSFKFSLPEGLKKGYYRVRIGSQVADLIINGTEKEIAINGNLAQLNEFNHKITGSPLTEQYIQAVQDYINMRMDVPALTKYTEETADPMVSFMIATRLFNFRTEFISLHQKVAARMSASHPDLEITQGYKEIIGQLEAQVKMAEASAKIKVGQPAPEISLPGPDGKIRKLSSYKGKLVLVDFWASWCGPCRKANPHVVELYHKYKSKGFDVFSVSLDGLDSRTAERFAQEGVLKEQMEAQKQRWIAAIQQDQLTWDGHVSDLKKWECAPAGEYGVRSIPQTFLVGRDGNIAAINPRADLEQQILKFL
ncbi:MAG: AhpC/TSA family protein [Saprospiraceae bacterium]|nr:AhpC/TSA family protein [Saprospiraceae bacterium]